MANGGFYPKPQQNDIVVALPIRLHSSLFLNPVVPTIYIRPTT